MSGFLAVLAVFIGSHALAAAPPIRRALIVRLSETGFLAAYSAMSLGLFSWLLITAMRAPTVPVWPAAPGAYLVTILLMPVALVLLGASLLHPNPLSIALVAGGFDPARPGAVAVTRHPILWGLGLWGLAHIPPNGDTVMLVLFGTLGVFAFIGMAVVERRKRRTLGEARWRELAAATSVLPFGALVTGRARWPRDLPTAWGAAIGAAFAAFLLLGGHQLLFNRDPLAFF